MEGIPKSLFSLPLYRDGPAGISRKLFIPSPPRGLDPKLSIPPRGEGLDPPLGPQALFQRNLVSRYLFHKGPGVDRKGGVCEVSDPCRGGGLYSKTWALSEEPMTRGITLLAWGSLENNVSFRYFFIVIQIFSGIMLNSKSSPRRIWSPIRKQNPCSA